MRAHLRFISLAWRAWRTGRRSRAATRCARPPRRRLRARSTFAPRASSVSVFCSSVITQRANGAKRMRMKKQNAYAITFRTNAVGQLVEKRHALVRTARAHEHEHEHAVRSAHARRRSNDRRMQTYYACRNALLTYSSTTALICINRTNRLSRYFQIESCSNNVCFFDE